MRKKAKNTQLVVTERSLPKIVRAEKCDAYIRVHMCVQTKRSILLPTGPFSLDHFLPSFLVPYTVHTLLYSPIRASPRNDLNWSLVSLSLSHPLTAMDGRRERRERARARVAHLSLYQRGMMGGGEKGPVFKERETILGLVYGPQERT